MPRGQKRGFRHSKETKKQISETLKKLGNLPHRFKKGNEAPSHAFKKGQAPWNRGIKMPEMGKQRIGKNNPNWKGGIKEEGGYIWIFSPFHPHARRNYAKRANLIMEEHIGRYLLEDETVHHKNNNRKDDRIKNLQMCKNRSEHMSIHRNS